METFSAQLREVQKTGEHGFQIEVAQYNTVPAVWATVQRLNEVFAPSGVNYPVNAEELGAILLPYAPIIAVNDRIVSTGEFPEIARLLDAVDDLQLVSQA